MIGLGATLNERFTLEKELGQGGMGTVYRATDRVLGRNVAIKLLKDSGAEGVARRIRLEAQILARLVHDRIVRLYDFSESEGTHFLVMEEVNGSSFLNRWRDLPLHDRLRVCGQVAEALEYAHLQGVIHRDVKPGNVLLTPGDEAKLSDFGLSLVTDDRGDESGTIRGTPRYMSPEQARGTSLDHRADLYSLGVMLYECATGVVPFVGHAIAVIDQHINAAPEAPRFKNPELSSTLDNLVLSLLEKSPAKRPASGGAVALALVEEAERARRLERVSPGPRRPEPTGRVDPGTVVLSVTGAHPSAPEVTGPTADLGSYGHPVAREMLTKTLATPIVISPEERYLCGHYLAYLLGGSRRQGLFLRRPLDARNADRARLLLAMTWLSCVEPTDEAIGRASALLEDRPDVRAALSPVVVVKYLAGRDTPAKRKRFRQTRRRLQEASAYAREAMLNPYGVLNPGMMPRTLDDLATIAPPLDTLDAHRVSLWNRVKDVWRERDDFRKAVLRYATRSAVADADTAGAGLWPEVVYPLIERAHWQRAFRPRHEAIWDYLVGKVLRIPVPGVRLDRMMIVAIPVEVTEQFNEDLLDVVDDPRLDEDEAGPAESRGPDGRRPFYVGGTIPREEPPSDDEVPRVKEPMALSPADPFLITEDLLRDLWQGAMLARDHSPRPDSLHKTIPIGPYRLAVAPTGRGKSAVRAVLQVQPGKQVEIISPSVLARGPVSRTVIAIWVYRDGSVAVAHLDFQSKGRYILWHAPNAHQFNFVNLAELRHTLSSANMETPDQLDLILTKT